MGVQVIPSVRELLAWDGPRAIVTNTIGILSILFLLPTEQLPLLPVRSLWEHGFGVLPYSAGTMRGLSLLLHGRFQEAWVMNPLAYAAGATLLGLLVRNAWLMRRSQRRD